MSHRHTVIGTIGSRRDLTIADERGHPATESIDELARRYVNRYP